MKVRDYQIWLISSIALITIACNTKTEKKSESFTSSNLNSVIQNDISDGPLTSSEIDLNEANLPKKKYIADMDHSSISFRTKHWGIVDLIGWFSDFNVIMYADSADFSDAEIYAEVKPTSLKMPNPKMTGTAQKAPYIDSEKFPKATFRSRSMNPMDANNYELVGDFSLNGVSKEVTFHTTMNGFAYPGEKSICGFDVTGKIDRNDFEVAGDNKLHSGRKVHGDTIELFLSLRME